jgi:hypothetical protein
MVGLGLNEAYDYEGPLLVGPGIDHKSDASTISWKHLPIYLTAGSDERVKFIKALELTKGAGTSATVSGFVMMIPYHGPMWDGASAYNKGLPRTGYEAAYGVVRYVVVYVYWDDAEYTVTAGGSETKSAGWRARILNQSCTGTSLPGTEVSAQAPTNMDVAYEGQLGYITNPDVCGTDAQYWGSPYRVASDERDNVTGIGAMYYDSDLSYVTFRSFGDGFAEAEQPRFDKHEYGDADSGRIYRYDTHLIGDPGEGGRGDFLTAGDTNETFTVGVTLYRTTDANRTQMYSEDHVTILAGSTSMLAHTFLFLHESIWSAGWDRVELWRSVRNGAGLLFRESYSDLPALPAYDATQDGPDSEYRRFLVIWGAASIALARWDISHITAEDWWEEGKWRDACLKDGKPDSQLLNQEYYDYVFEYDGDPPSNATRVSIDNQVSMVIDAKGDNSDETTSARPVVPPFLRWSSLGIPNPEKYSDTENRWRPDAPIGMVYGLETAGDTTFVVGTRGITATRRVGSRMSFNRLEGDLAPVNRWCYCVAAGRLVTLSRGGVFLINGYDNSITPMLTANRLLLGSDEWGSELTKESQSLYPAIGIAFDPSGNCLYIWNSNRLECLCVWLTTGYVTRLFDFPWTMGVQGVVPTVRFDSGGTRYDGHYGERAYFLGERGATETHESADEERYVDLYYGDFSPEVLMRTDDVREYGCYTMHGRIGRQWNGTEEASIELLNGTIVVMDREYVVVASQASDYGTDIVKELNRRLVGGYLHLWNSEDTLHVRRQILGVTTYESGGTHYFKVYIGPTLSLAAATALSGGTWSLAPVTMRVIPSLVSVEDSTQGQWYSIVSLGSQLDFVATRGVMPSSGTGPNYTADVTGMKIYAVGWRLNDALLTDEGSYGPDAPVYNPSILKVLEWGESANPYTSLGRIREVVRTAVTASRKNKDTTTALQFAGDDVTGGLEAYPSGVQVALRGIRLNGNILAGSRRT